nr:beta-galactosidase [Bifidobacterium longum]
MGGDSMVNPPQRLGYKRFGNDMLLDFYKAERDAIEAICPGKPWYMMEHSTSAVQWKPLNTRKRAGELWELDGVPAITSHPPPRPRRCHLRGLRPWPPRHHPLAHRTQHNSPLRRKGSRPKAGWGRDQRRNHDRSSHDS